MPRKPEDSQTPEGWPPRPGGKKIIWNWDGKVSSKLAAVPIAALAATGGNTALAPESVSKPLPAEQPQALDARSVQPYYAKLIAQSLGLRFTAEIAGDDVILSARY